MLIKRWLSIIVDYLYAILFFLIQGLIFKLFIGNDNNLIFFIRLFLLILIIIIKLVYFPNTSLGKNLFGLIIVDKENREIGARHSLKRIAILLLLLSFISILHNYIFYKSVKSFSGQIILFNYTWSLFVLLYYMPLFFSNGMYTLLDIMLGHQNKLKHKINSKKIVRIVLLKSVLLSLILVVSYTIIIFNLQIKPKFNDPIMEAYIKPGFYIREGGSRSLMNEQLLDSKYINKNNHIYDLKWSDILLDEKNISIECDKDIRKLTYPRENNIYKIPIDVLSEITIVVPTHTLLNSNVRNAITQVGITEVGSLIYNRLGETKYGIKFKYISQFGVFPFIFGIEYNEYLILNWFVSPEFNSNKVSIKKAEIIVPDNSLNFQLSIFSIDQFLQIKELFM